MAQTKRCPDCRRINRASASRCECGYDFEDDREEGTPKRRRPRPGQARAIYAVGLVGFAIMCVNALVNTRTGRGFDIFLLVGLAGIVWCVVGLIRGR